VTFLDLMQNLKQPTEIVAASLSIVKGSQNRCQAILEIYLENEEKETYVEKQSVIQGKF
jgi:hypothetical protein